MLKKNNLASEEDKNLKLLTKLIEECIEDKVENLKILKNDLDVRSTKERAKSLDIVVESKGKKVNIELNTSTNLSATIGNLNFFYGLL